jgi:hypothetical protein
LDCKLQGKKFRFVSSTLLGSKDSKETKKIKSEAGKKRWSDPIEIQKQRERFIGNHNFGDVSGSKNPMFGKHHSNETKQKIGAKSRGQHWKLSKEQRLARSGNNNPMSRKNTRLRFLKVLCKRTENIQ